MRRQLIKKIAVAVALTGILGNLTACGTKEAAIADEQVATSAEGEETVIRVADFTGGGCIWNNQFIVAHEAGLYDEIFKDDNVSFEVTQFASGPAVNEAFLAGEVDIVNGIGDQPLVIGIGNGVETTILTQTASQGTNQGIVAKKSSGINSVEDLKGKRVAVNIGTFIHKSVIGVLADAGLTEDDVELVNLSNNSDIDAAFENGDIDASYANGYSIASKLATGDFVQVADFEKHPLYSYIVVSNSFLEAHPDYVQKFVQGLYEGEQYYNNNRDDAYDLISAYSDLDLEQVKKILDGANTTIEFTDGTRQNLVNTYNFLSSHDLITTTITEEEIDKHIDRTFIDAVWGK